jgi:hypothetical protein
MMEADSERSNKNSSVVRWFKQCLCSLQASNSTLLFLLVVNPTRLSNTMLPSDSQQVDKQFPDKFSELASTLGQISTVTTVVWIRQNPHFRNLVSPLLSGVLIDPTKYAKYAK